MVKGLTECDAIEIGGRVYVAADKTLKYLAGSEISIKVLRIETTSSED